MFDLITAVIFAITAIASPPSPYTYHSYIAETRTNSLASSLLAVSEIPHPPEKSLALEEKGENIKMDEEGVPNTPEATTERRNEEILAIKDLIKRYFPKEPVMIKIALCESSLIHYENGKILKGRTTPDYGVFQINEIWIPIAEKLGIDIYDLEGNIKMAKYIYDTQGLSAWSSSFKNCWKNI